MNVDNLTNLFDDMSIDLNIIKSQRGSSLLIDDESFEYKISYKCKSNPKITWRCNDSTYVNCHGSVYTIGFKRPIFKIKQHEHEPTIKTQVKKIISNLKDISANQPDSKPRKIILENEDNLPAITG